MTILDTNHSHTRTSPIGPLVRVAFVIGLLAFGWFALTIGTDPGGAPTIVSEPVAQPE